jgi:hypothetical protein
VLAAPLLAFIMSTLFKGAASRQLRHVIVFVVAPFILQTPVRQFLFPVISHD